MSSTDRGTGSNRHLPWAPLLASAALFVSALLAVTTRSPLDAASSPQRSGFGPMPSTEAGEPAEAGAVGSPPTYVDDAQYVDAQYADAQCASCHADIAASFQSLGMARSFARAGDHRPVEIFDGDVVVRGGVHHRMEQRGEDLVYARWQEAADGEPIHRWERRVDWVLGSGSTSRVYLVQTKEGTLYELPIAWYSQEDHRWAPTPGTEEADREASLRLVRRECMFCHNAFPVPAVDDRRFAPQQFPRDLPAGIGCQRCHGPGAAHVQAARAPRPEGMTPEQRRDLRQAIRSSIVDPADLPPSRRRDVCAQCHHQPAVALFGQRRYHRDDLDYRPGQDLADFLFKLEVFELDAEGEPRPPSQRFEINHHAYRLEQSPCFLESSPGAIECTSCHDPHRKPPREEILATTRQLCRSCHSEGEGTLGADEPVASASRSARTAPVGTSHFDSADCVSCHMPRRRTEDIVRVVMTDHRIQRRPAPAEERLAPRPERTPRIDDVRALDPSPAAATPFDDLIRATAGIRAGTLGLVTALEPLLVEARRTHPDADLSEPALRLGVARLNLGHLEQARAALEPLLDHPDVGEHAAANLAVVALREDEADEALALLDRAIAAGPPQAALHFNRGLVRLSLERNGACTDLERAVELNELLVRGWLRVADCRRDAGDLAGTVGAWSIALALDPAAETAVAPLVAALRELGRPGEAERLARHHGLGDDP